MIRKKIAVLRGGPSSEYEISLVTGKTILDELADDYDLVDVLVDKNGSWYVNGFEKKPQEAIKSADLVFNAMHGEYGEDGKVQQLLENLKVPFTGPGSLSAAMAMNKERAKEVYKKHGIKTPLHKVISQPDTEEGIEFQAMLVFKNFPMPVVLKPVDKGSSVGVSVARTFDSLKDTMKSLYAAGNAKILIEEYIEGKEATVGVIEEFRNKKKYAMLPIEIRTPKTKSFFDYDSKLTGEAEQICPGNFGLSEKEELQKIAELAHEILGLRHYSRSDFIVHPKRGIYLLETNSLPGLRQVDPLVRSFEPVGLSMRDFLVHVIELV